MPRGIAPSYRFEFPGGLTQRGHVVRAAPTIDGGRTHRFRFHLDDRPLAFPLRRRMPADVADLVDVCAAIYLADRLSPRAAQGDVRPSNERWHRRIDEVAIPVRRPDVWRSADASRLLDQLTSFISDDHWSFRFDRRESAPRPAEGQAQMFPNQQQTPSLAVLHSGGLDSLFGLIDAANRTENETVLAVTVSTHPRLRLATQQVLAALRRAVPTVHFDEVGLRIGISGLGRARCDREPSQRTRALLYLAAGVSAAVMSGGDTLRVTENGPGAINLPCTPDQLGARATRAMHPKTLALFADLASLILNRQIVVSNGGLFRTKGELAEILRDGRYAAAARETVSCERFPYHPAHRGCGICSSCIYRRIALGVAGVEYLDDRRYAHADDFDLLASGLEWGRVDFAPLYAQRELVARLEALLTAERKFAAMVAEFPTLDDVVSVAASLGLEHRQAQGELVRLFEVHVREVATFFARIDRPGWSRAADVSALMMPVIPAAAS